MGKTRGVHETTPELRNRMVGMYEAGLGLREIAAAVNCSQRTVKRWLNRFDKEGTVETRERCGRKRATTVEQDEAIVRLATQTPITAAKAVLPALGLSCSVDTIRERLHKAGIHNWSPSRKHMQRIPLGDTDGAAIQQAVWRPTGTQLGKRKTVKGVNKTKKMEVSNKKRIPRKVKGLGVSAGGDTPVDNTRQSEVHSNFNFQTQNTQLQCNGLQQTPQIPLPTNTNQYGDNLSLVSQPQNVYQQSVPSLNVGQHWPLDLVQNNHQYPQSQEAINHHGEHSLPRVHIHQQVHNPGEPQMQQQIPESHSEPSLHSHQHNNLKHQTQHSNEHQNLQQQQPQNELSNTNTSNNVVIHSDCCSNSCNSDDTALMSNSCNSDDTILLSNESFESNKDESNSDQEKEKSLKKKKGGKVKGTLETSVEIRNRMIGMSEAGLSTLSIALAINRSERTVKRWLERWHKEGNVQTKERKGRRRITTKEQDEAIVAMATQHPLTAAKYVAPALGLKCSVDTIRERLHKAGIHSWKLGKKQGEGNAVHTVHLWQPSGNRPNKPKSERKKKLQSKKQDRTSENVTKKIIRKKKEQCSTLQKTVPPPANMITEPSTVQFHNQTQSVSIMQPIPNIVPSPSVMMQQQQQQQQQQLSPASQVPTMQSLGSMMQQQDQRSDCRIITPIGLTSSSCQGSNNLVYTSCVVGNNNHPIHMEQTDSINYEPYIWSF